MQAFLQKALDPHSTLDESDVEALLKPSPTREGLHLEYKRGEWLNRVHTGEEYLEREPRSAAARIRKHIASFANADGGALVVGVADDRARGEGVPPWTITGCRSPGKASLHEWASDAVQGLGVLHPVVHVVSTSSAPHGAEVLIIAVDRFHRLMPCVENGTSVYYVRLGASTVRADDWLLRDLFLTRRARPHIIPTARAVTYDEDGGHIDRRYSFDGTISIENASPVWASRVHATLLGLWEDGTKISDSAHAGVHIATDGLGQLVQSIAEADQGAPPWDLPPFGRLDLRFGIRVLDNPGVRGRWLVCGGLLVTSRDHLPQWIQVVFQGATNGRGVAATTCAVTEGSKPLIFAGSPDQLFECGVHAYLPKEVMDFVLA